MFRRFNDFYVNIGKNLFKKISDTDKDPTSYIKQSNMSSFFLKEVTHVEFTKIIINMFTKEG